MRARLRGLLAGALCLLCQMAQSAPPAPVPAFIDIAAASGVNFRNQASHTSRKYLVETMVGGVALLDYNRDGRLDVFFVNGAAIDDPMPAGKTPDKTHPRYWNRLYRNDGAGKFTDVTEAAGLRGHSYGMGVAVGDYDNDGWPDLYVTNYGRNILYHNNGNGTFTDVTEKSGAAGGGWSVSALFVDYDRDGYLDLVVSRYMKWDFSMDVWCGERRPGFRSFCHPDDFEPISNLLYHNNGDGTFTDVTARSGLGAAPAKGLGSSFQDFDRDGWPDIVVANDAAPQQLFHNNGDGTFTEVAMTAGMAYDEDGRVFSGMGVAFEDYDNDGWPDLFIDNLANQRYALFHNVKGSFQYASPPTNLAAITLLHSGWGTAFVDLDNDGWKDLFVVQSHVMDNIEICQPPLRYHETPLLLRNLGGRFRDVSEQSGAPFQVARPYRGAAFGDWNNDGFVDIAINVLEGQAVMLQAEGNGNHWLLVNPEGTLSNRDGIGAQLHLVSASGQEQYAQVSTAGSYASASDKRVHFGLGADRSVKLLEIRWPSGVVQSLRDFPADQILNVREPRTPKPQGEAGR